MRTTATGLLVSLTLLLSGCSGGDADTSDAPSEGGSSAASSTASPSAAAPQGPCEYTASGTAAREVDLPSGAEATGNPRVTLETTRGEIPIDLDTDLAPCTVASFVSLAEQAYYDDTTCHRLTAAGAGIFVLQCGDPTGSGAGGPGYVFDDEVDQLEDELQCSGNACIYPTGTVAMANAGPGTNGSQFFLVYEDSPLPPAFTVFGEMSPAGLQVVQKIAEAGTVDGAAPNDGPPALETVIVGVDGLPASS